MQTRVLTGAKRPSSGGKFVLGILFLFFKSENNTPKIIQIHSYQVLLIRCIRPYIV